MIIKKEIKLIDFEFWGNAIDNIENLTGEEFDILETILDDLYLEEIDETDLNGLFSFEFEAVLDWLGIDEEEYYNRD